MREEGESLADYAKRVAEKLRIQQEARRENEPRYDAECHATEQVESLGLQVCDTAYALKPDVTTMHRVMVIETPHLAGYQLRVIAERVSLGELSYDTVQNMRQGEPHGIDAITRATVRQLMVAQLAEAKAWLEANPEP